jgi:PRTRC genetic system protein A
MNLKLVHHLLMEQPALPPIPWPYGYVIAQNGVYVWARREGLEALVPLASCTIRGLCPVEPYVRLDYPPVDTVLVTDLVERASNARTADGSPLEMLFYLHWDTGEGWVLTIPIQEQQPMRVTPVKEGLDATSYANTLMEIHSHHCMPAFFSSVDTADEQGFRLYGVLGHLAPGQSTAEIRMRVGVFGHFFEIRASQVLSLPAGVTEAMAREESQSRGEEEDTADGNP